MSELLRWYEFPKLRNRTSLSVESFVTRTSPLRETPGFDSKSEVRDNAVATLSNKLAGTPPFLDTMKPAINSSSSPLLSPVEESFDRDSSDSEAVKGAEDMNEVNPCESPSNLDSPFSDSSMDSISKSGQLWKCLSKHSSKVTEAPAVVLCFWCKRVCEVTEPSDTEGVRPTFPLTNGDRHFCSEICFNQCRRASFKKSKVCDWCRHVRPTVSYVDFTDGNHQLQFCGDKCLNQYKMHIFCRETEAHLQLHPHLNDLKVGKESTLITPDLWFRDCEESKSQGNSRELHKDVDENDSEEERKEPRPAEGGEKSRVSSCSSFGDVSPVSLFDDTEPVNLSTTSHPSESKRSPSRYRDFRWTEDHLTRMTSRYGRLPKSTPVEVGYPGRPKIQKVSNLVEVPDAKPKGTIRVRQLEEQVHCRESESSISSSSPSTTASLPSLTSLGGILMGSRPPLLPGISNLLPPPPSELPRPQILPQLLLSHPDLLRLQGLRPSFLLPPQPPMHTPQPTPPIPPPLPPHNLPPPPPPPNPPKHSGFPPVTVLLPLPLPIPIPIPIPFPFPIPVKEPSPGCSGQKEGTVEDRERIRPQETLRKEHDADQQIETPCSSHKRNKPNSPIPFLGRLPPRAKVSAGVDKETPQRERLGESSQQESLLPKATRKERRSILRYTSDVYEINGVFVPRGGGWDSLGTVKAPSKDKKEEDTSSSSGLDLVPVLKLGGPETLSSSSTPEESVRMGGSSRKRPLPDSPPERSSQPLPKKKHLLT